MTHYGEEESRMGRRVRGMINGRWGDSGRALTRSPFLLCCKSRQLTTWSYVVNPHLLYLVSREVFEFLGHYGSLW
jgi:hypothetical protein